MLKKPSKLESAQKRAELAIEKTNGKINELGKYTQSLYIASSTMQAQFDCIRNVTEETKFKYEKTKAIQLNWRKQADNIELKYTKANVKTARKGAIGVGVGISVISLGPTAAMGIATTFGVASTGTPIAVLHGAAATNAALAWLGGGALATGGGGMVAGNALLSLAGPVGLAIAGISIVATGLMAIKSKAEKDKLENIYTLISERDIRSYDLAIVEINERIKRIKDELKILNEANIKIETFGPDYNLMTEEQQYELGTYVNLMEAATMLLVNPILGLQPKFSEEDFDMLCYAETSSAVKMYFTEHKNMIISMANLLYKITLDEKDKNVLVKSLKKNKEFLASVQMGKKEFGIEDLTMVDRALNYIYKRKT